MPLGSAAMVSSGHSSSGRFQGRSSSAGSAIADVMLSEPAIRFLTCLVKSIGPATRETQLTDDGPAETTSPA